ncbi:CD82 antigen-like [Amphiura filiformis]|uniref:CD82 antigen-like n=1 Tax=Amphiura filiformis TaxID=82378 RepID=UPI003B2194CC
MGDSHCCKKCLKYFFIIINVILALCGLGLIVVGCLIHFGLANWIPIQELAAVFNQNEFIRSTVYMFIGAGAVAFLIAICGCLGVVLEITWLLALYLMFLVIIIAVQLAAGILAAIYSNEITSFLDKEGKDFLEMDYGNKTAAADEASKLATKGWDVIQQTLECCGVDGQGDYANNPNVQGNYPDSCRRPREQVEDPDTGMIVFVPGNNAYPNVKIAIMNISYLFIGAVGVAK